MTRAPVIGAFQFDGSGWLGQSAAMSQCIAFGALSTLPQPRLRRSAGTHMIIDSRRILGGVAIFALVLMRLVIGWHFCGEGLEKVEYDRHDGTWHRVFSADKEFLELAKGPLAPAYLAHTLSDHEWRTLLATPRENTPLTDEQTKAQADWAK